MSSPQVSRTKLWRMWFVVVAIFSAFGPFLSWEDRERLQLPDTLEYTGNLAALGVGVATCLTTSLCLLADARSGRRKKARAILLTLALPLPCAILTLVVVVLTYQILPPDWVSEFGFLSLLYTPLYSLIGSLAVAVTTSLIIGRRPARAAGNERGEVDQPNNSNEHVP